MKSATLDKLAEYLGLSITPPAPTETAKPKPRKKWLFRSHCQAQTTSSECARLEGVELAVPKAYLQMPPDIQVPSSGAYAELYSHGIVQPVW